MSLAFYNTLSRKKEIFTPIVPGEVKLYTCGPTVYDYSHIGNARTYLFEDLLRRWLKLSGYRVTQVMNITDVDDKTIRGSKNQKIPLSSYTREYIDYFFEDLRTLRIERAEHYPKATEHIPEMVEIISHLLSKEIAYRGDDGSIYYSVAKFPGYGELAHMKVAELLPGARVRHDEYDKAQASDFALWKAWDPEDGPVYWETILGKGRPGWHIECSAMSMKYLGAHFDIHTGGVDNIFPHHQNEIAQSEAHTEQKFVNYWLHAEHLIVDGRKMSKSLENFYTVRDVLKQQFSPLALRYFYASSHYRNKLNFTFPALAGAFSSVTRFHDFLGRLAGCRGTNHPLLSQTLEETRREFKEALDDDLNTPKALGSLHDLINKLNPLVDEQGISSSQARDILVFFQDVDKLFGIGLREIAKPEELPPEIQTLIDAREKARKDKDFRKADELRAALQEKGYTVEDTLWGPRGKSIRL